MADSTPPQTGSTGPSETGPRILGEFRLLRKLGQGGMAEVWLAEQTSLERKVAIKLLRPELMADETHVTRFQREASSAGGLNHPNIVQVHTIGEADGQHYIAQEYVKGMTLKAYLKKKGPPELTVALHIMKQVAAALKAADKAGVVHRDIKPENIMISRKADVKVADFGLAQLYGGDEGVDITQEGTTMGTPLYMSPEQVQGKKVDPRSDIYSFGVTCYHMLTGRPPFEGPTAMSVAAKHLRDDAPLLKNQRPDLPPALSDIVSRMMEKSPDDRYQSADEVLTDIRLLMKAVRQADRPSQVDADALAPVSSSRSSGRKLSSRAAIIVLTLLFLVTAGASAGIGWLTRPADPMATSPRVPENIRRMESARDQYKHAMFLGNNVDAWIAVVENWDPVGDRLWVRQAQEQLALLYLQDKSQWDRAEKMLTTLESYGTENRRYLAESLAGLAALRAYQGNAQAAKNILDSRLGKIEDSLPKDSAWEGLANEARLLISQEKERLRQGG